MLSIRTRTIQTQMMVEMDSEQLKDSNDNNKHCQIS
jgi:hypothetical protein